MSDGINKFYETVLEIVYSVAEHNDVDAEFLPDMLEGMARDMRAEWKKQTKNQ